MMIHALIKQHFNLFIFWYWSDRLSFTLVRANARAILTRSYTYIMQQVDEIYV